MHPVGERHAAPGVALAIRTGYRQNSERLQVCHCEAPAGPWQSREGTADANQLPIKWYAPIASVAALSERLWQLQIWRHARRSSKAPRFVIARRPTADVAISGRQLRFRQKYPVIRPGSARFPRRFAPRNDNSDNLAPPNHHCNTRSCLRRSQPARGTPHP